MAPLSEDELVREVRQAAAGPVRRYARAVDRERRFPEESLDALRSLGLAGYFIPRELGGVGGSLDTYVKVAALLGEECLSTAVVWAMHAQQVDVLVNQEFEGRERVLGDIAARQLLVASVTTEYGKGGSLLNSISPLVRDGSRLRVERAAPIVACAEQAEYFLITMKAADKASAPTLVLVHRADGEIKVTGPWNTLGMRGTMSLPMSFNVTVPPERIIGESFRQLVIRTMIPVGHLGWVAAWFGAARGAFSRVLSRLRQLGAKKEKNLDSDLLRARLAEVRVSLDLVEAMLASISSKMDRLRAERAPQEAYEEITFNIAVNNLKIAGSRMMFAAVDQLVEICGLFGGYVEDDEMGLERVFRDMRSASLMFHNDRLLDANGNLVFVEHTRLQMLWKSS